MSTTVLSGLSDATPRARATRFGRALFPYWPFALITLVVIVTFGPDIADTAHIPYDLEYYHYPLLGTVQQMLAHGRMPFWDQDTYGGVPLLANAQSEWLYLPHLVLYAVLIVAGRPLSVHQLTLVVISHIWLAGIGTCLLARSRGYNTASAAFAGGFITCCGIVLEETQHLAYPETMAWIPFSVLLIDRMAVKVTPRLVAGQAALFFMMVTAGFLPMVIPAAIVLVGFALARESGHLRALAGTLGGIVLGALLSAAVLMPVAAISSYFPPELPYNTHRLSSLVTVIYPNAFKYWNPVSQAGAVPWLDGDYFYVGGVGLVMLPISLFGGRKAIAGTIFTAAILVLSIGPIGEHIAHFIQGLSSSYGPLYRPALVLYAGAPQIALFLAGGLRRAPRPHQLALAGVGIAVLVVIGISNSQGHALRLFSSAPSFELVSIFGALLLLIAAWRLPARYTTAALGLCAILGLLQLSLAARARFWVNYPGIGVAPSTELNTTALQTIKADLKPGQRVGIDALDLGAGWNSLPPLWGLSSTNGFQPQFSKYQLERVNSLGGAGSEAELGAMNREFPTTANQLAYYREMDAPLIVADPAADTFAHKAGFTQIANTDGVVIYRVNSSMGRAWILDQPCLSSHGVAAIASCSAGDVQTTLTSDRSRRLTLPRSSATRTVVVSEPYYPGWSATANGKSLRVRRLGYLTAITVPSGVISVTLSYFPPGLLSGLAVSILTLIGLIVVATLDRVPFIERIRQRVSGGERSSSPSVDGIQG